MIQYTTNFVSLQLLSELTLHSLFGPPAGLPIGRLDLLHAIPPAPTTVAAGRQHILDDPGDVEEADAARQERRDSHLVGRIQHGRCKSTQSQSLSRQT